MVRGMLYGAVCATHRMANPTAVQHPAKVLAPMVTMFTVRFCGGVVLVGGWNCERLNISVPTCCSM